MTSKATIQENPKTGKQANRWKAIVKADCKIAKPVLKLEYNGFVYYRKEWK
jgi:hypothetical protein